MTCRGDVSVREELQPGIREEVVGQGGTPFHNNGISLSGLIGEVLMWLDNNDNSKRKAEEYHFTPAVSARLNTHYRLDHPQTFFGGLAAIGVRSTHKTPRQRLHRSELRGRPLFPQIF